MENFVKNTLSNADFNQFRSNSAANNEEEKSDSFKYSKFSPFRKDHKQRTNNNFSNPYPKPPRVPEYRSTNSVPLNQTDRFAERELRNKKKRSVCNNCGIQGHLTVDCKQPVQSYGLIILNQAKDRVLLVQRRDSFGYISLINSENVPSNSISRISKTITQTEQQKLLCFDFDSLWKDVINDQRLQKNSRIIDLNRRRFQENQVKNIVGQISPDALRTDTEWGFPKGRIKKREKWNECARREASEETGIPENNLEIISDMPFMENIKGFDGRMYINIYYVGQIVNDFPSNSLSPQVNEIKKVDWIDMNNIEQFLSVSSSETKKKLIHQVKHFLKSIPQVIQ